MKVGQAAHKSLQLLSAISFLSLAIDFCLSVGFSGLLLKRDFSMKDAEEKRNKFTICAAYQDNNCPWRGLYSVRGSLHTERREKASFFLSPSVSATAVPFLGAQNVKEHPL